MYEEFPLLVYHERYSADPWPETHSFPMSKFMDLAQLLGEEDGPLGKSGPLAINGAFRPMERPPDEWFEAVHDAEYYRSFLEGGLDEKAMRRRAETAHLARDDGAKADHSFKSVCGPPTPTVYSITL